MSAAETRKKIAVVFTGGTITMLPRQGAAGVVPDDEAHRLLEALAPLHHEIGIQSVPWGNRPSPHMDHELMFRLAKDLDALLTDPALIGAVVLHGTDLLVESAFLADLCLETRKPVVFTGSMRFYSELGYDGIRNLLGGIKACLLPIPEEMGVVLLMTDRLFAAREVVKVNSLNIDAFEAPGSGPVGYVAGESLMLTRHPQKRLRPFQARALDTRVPMVSCFPGIEPGIIDALSATSPAGLVVEGFGAGNVPPGLVEPLLKLINNQIPVVLTTRCIDGGVWPLYGYPGGGADLETRGIISGGRLTAHKAQIQLMACLGSNMDPAAIRRVFQTICH